MSQAGVESLQPTPAKPGLLTPFNVVSAIILIGGAVILALRFTKGLEATTNLTTPIPGDCGSGLMS